MKFKDNYKVEKVIQTKIREINIRCKNGCVILNQKSKITGRNEHIYIMQKHALPRLIKKLQEFVIKND